MGELRHINAQRDDLVRAIAEAPGGAALVLVVDGPDPNKTRVMWHAPAPIGVRGWSWFASVFQMLARDAWLKATRS